MSPLPLKIQQYYQEVGPDDVLIPSYGNDFSLPSLASLWARQAGYKWNGFTQEPITEWDDDWLVVADQGGDPFIYSISSGAVLHDVHGCGIWKPTEMFVDLPTMAACLGRLGQVVDAASGDFVDDDHHIRPRFFSEATVGLQNLLGNSPGAAEIILHRLGWTE